MIATPLCAGSTLCAKEYVASRLDDTGRLVLSEFTGTTADLPEAIIVNPHDIDALKGALLAACRDTTAARQVMHTMRERLQAVPAERWAGRFLSELGTCAAA